MHNNLNLKNEFDKLLLGYPRLSQIMILRSIDYSQLALGADLIKGGSTSDAWDKGEHYGWSEVFCNGYFTRFIGASRTGQVMNLDHEIGRVEEDNALVFLKAEVTIKAGDCIFRIRNNIDGTAYYPIERSDKWRILQALDCREFNNELAFWQCKCQRLAI